MLTIPNVTQSVHRPIVLDIVEQVKAITKINESTDVYFVSDEGYSQTPGSAIAASSHLPKLGAKRMVLIDVEQSTNLDNLATSVSNRSEHIPILEDEKLGFLVRPIYESTDVKINFKYRTISKQEAKRWKDDIAIRVSAMRDMFVHSLHYHYGLPPQIWNLLGEIHSKREMNQGYGETFGQYIERLSKGRLTVVGEGTGTNTLPVIAEKATRIIGLFDFEAIPEKSEYEEETGTYMISFTYKFTYDCPVGCNAVYPIMVHNQYLADEYIVDTTAYPRLDLTPKRYSESGYAFAHFESEPLMSYVHPADQYIRIPSIDDYIMPTTHAGTATAILLLMSMDKPGKDQVMFNLQDLGDVQIDPDIMQFLVEVEYPYLTKLYYSVFHLSLLENDQLCDPMRLSVNNRMEVITHRNIDLRKTYRVRFALFVDLSLLHPSALERLARYPKAWVKFFQSANKLLHGRADFQNLGDQNYISQAQINLMKMLMGGISTANAWGGGISGGFAPGGYNGGGMYTPNSFGSNGSYSSGINDENEHLWTTLTRKGSLFQDVPWEVVQQWIKHARSMKTVQLSGIIAIPNNT